MIYNLTVPAIKAVFFDLGGTLWAPFGDRARQEVLEEATRELVREVYRVLRESIEPEVFMASLKGKIDGLKDVPSPGLQEDILRELASLRRRANLDPESLPNLSLFREVDFSATVRDSLKDAGVTLDADRVAQVASRFAAALCAGYKTYPDTLDALDTLKDRGFIVGVVSNTSIPPEIIDRYLLESGILERVDFRVLSSETGWRKPHPAIYRAALDRTGVFPWETLFVGDRFLEDVAGPKSVGMKAALCRVEGPSPGGVPEEFLPDLQVLDLHELLANI